MHKAVKPLAAALGALILGLAPPPLGAENPPPGLLWALRGTVMAFPGDNGLEADPMPVLPSPGAALDIPLAGPLGVEFALDLYSTHYGYSEILGRAVPLAVENRWTTVVGFVAGLELLCRFNLTPRAALRVYGGPGADLRLCLIAEDLNGDEQEEAARHTALVADYFWRESRWFLPVFGAGMDFKLGEKLGLGFDLRAWFPVWKLWTAGDTPPLEGWRFGAGIRVTFF